MKENRRISREKKPRQVLSHREREREREKKKKDKVKRPIQSTIV